MYRIRLGKAARLGSSERLSRVRRILVGYDGSDGGRRALERSIAEVHDSRGRITVLSVANMPLDLDVPRNFGTLDDISADEGRPLAAPPEVVAQLREAGERLAKAGLEAELIWTAGEPGRAIVETAKEIRAQLIVLGEHHHGLLGNVFGADVDAEVQREAGCDVILA
jgi:nucleotide-binding universal stress UspA family protein